MIAIDQMADLFRDRHIDMLTDSDVMHQTSCADPFHDHVRTFRDLLRCLAFRHHHTGSVVAAVDRCAGADEISHPGKAEEGRHLCAEMYAEAGHFDQPACHESCATVIAQANAIQHTAGKCHDILQRTAVLDALDIVTAIHAEDRTHEKILYHLHRFRHFGRGDGRTRQPTSDFFGMVRPGEDDDLFRDALHLIRDDLGKSMTGMIRKSLGRTDDYGILLQPRYETFRHGFDRM